MWTKLLRVLSDLKSNRVLKGAISLIMGSAIAKGIGLAVMPILTRMYSAEDFGRLSLFVSVTTIAASLLTFRYVVALPIPSSRIRARHLLLLSVTLGAITAVLIGLVLAIAVYVFGQGSADGFWRAYWWLVIVGAIGAAGYELATMWATRRQQYHAISTSQVWQMLSGSATKLVGGFFGLGSVGLILGQVMQQSGGLAGLARPMLSSLRRALKEFNGRYLLAVAARYSDFPKYKMPAHFVYAYAAQAPVIMASYLWGASSTGQLGLAFQSMALPISLISQNASRVYYAELSKIGRGNPSAALELTRYMGVRLFGVGSLLGIGIFALAPMLFSLVFGQAWAEAGELARAMAIFIPFQFVASPLIMAYNIYGDQRRVLITHFIRAALVSMVFVLSYFLGLSLLKTIYIYAVVISVHYLLICRNVVKEISAS